ncbi:unnamed protein product [Onchocerca ochengi]|uniref:Uncharacterized protein n=1 Tax=Onchocerca ochengi TaxID=42157 RepID=A0A182EQY2_ONCOC|nr:unnamed protein product [Onchocerca ochengi]VDM94274.1 unnamed protein product [Onchocerca ochengi]
MANRSTGSNTLQYSDAGSVDFATVGSRFEPGNQKRVTSLNVLQTHSILCDFRQLLLRNVFNSCGHLFPSECITQFFLYGWTFYCECHKPVDVTDILPQPGSSPSGKIIQSLESWKITSSPAKSISSPLKIA